LRQPGANRDAIGARIVVEDSTGIVRSRQSVGGGSYLSTGDPRLRVGLGSAAGNLREIEVRWPSGTTSTFRDLEPDRYWLLEPSSPAAQPQ
jgi:hypothetical protein